MFSQNYEMTYCLTNEFIFIIVMHACMAHDRAQSRRGRRFRRVMGRTAPPLLHSVWFSTYPKCLANALDHPNPTVGRRIHTAPALFLSHAMNSSIDPAALPRFSDMACRCCLFQSAALHWVGLQRAAAQRAAPRYLLQAVAVARVAVPPRAQGSG